MTSPEAPLIDDGRGSFVGDLGLQLTPAGEVMRGAMEVTPELLAPGHEFVQLSVMATAGDVLIGQLANDRTPTLALTIDLSITLLAPIGLGTLQMESRLIKIGRTLVSGEAAWFDGDGRQVATCWATFMGSPRPVDSVLVVPDTGETRWVDRPLGPTMTAPFNDALGIRVPDRGVAEVDRSGYTLQPTGTLQGGVVCAVAEAAAVSLLDGPVSSIDIRYLAGIRIGSGRATADGVGPDLARVEVTDVARPDRIASVVHARRAPWVD